MQEKLIVIIIVNYKGSEDTIECLKSLRKLDYSNYKVIVVDNYSNDSSISILKKYITKEILICNNKNLGFAGGNNIGIKKAIELGAEYILLLNNDTVVDSDLINKFLIGFDYEENVGLVGCKINYYEEKDIMSYDGGEIIWNKFTTKFEGDRIKDKFEEEKLKEISFVSGCAMMINTSLISDVGMLDDSYFMYYEDTDYCVRVKEKGYKLIYQPNTRVYHKISAASGGQLSPFVLYWSTRNREKFKKKYYYKVSKSELVYFNIFNFISRLIKISCYLIKFDFDRANSIFKGYIAGLKEKRSYK